MGGLDINYQFEFNNRNTDFSGINKADFIIIIIIIIIITTIIRNTV
jgi:hypothetical protein